MIKGLPISPGIAIGRIYKLGGMQVDILERTISEEEIPEEMKRLEEALDKAKKELKELVLKSQENIGKEEA